MAGAFYNHLLRNHLCAHTAGVMQEVNSQMLEIVLIV